MKLQSNHGDLPGSRLGGFRVSHFRGRFARRIFCLSFDQTTTTREALDAVTCASVFNSDKGRFVTAQDEAIYRSYIDSWSVSAVNPEFRYYQEMSPYFQARFRYRYYQQTASFFYRSDPNSYAFEDPYVTADPKLSPFHVNEVGIQLLVLGNFLEGRAHRSIAGAQLDISFNYRWNTNAFGNQVVAQTGLRIPF